jgi:hypothetical protein
MVCSFLVKWSLQVVEAVVLSPAYIPNAVGTVGGFGA